MIPLKMGEEFRKVRMSVVEAQIPMLFGQDVIQKLGGILDFAKMSLTLEDKFQMNLKLNQKGHYTLDLIKNEEEVKEDDPSANTSLVSDDNMMLAAPVVSQPKVVVANWRKGSHIGPSSVILYCMQKYILGHLPLSFRGQRMIGNLLQWLSC